jgi:transglutaminase-like putative cysteine protease
MRFEVNHRTTYSYRLPVAQSYHQVHLQPRSGRYQSLVHHSLLIEPVPATSTAIVDYYGNAAGLLRIEDEHSELVVHARSTVEVVAPPRVDVSATCPWDSVAGNAGQPDGRLDVDVLQFSCNSRLTPASRQVLSFAREFFPPGRPVLEGALALTVHIQQAFKFDPTATDVSTPIAHVLEQRRGVCQDFAHLGLAALRTLGIPARYVSGYLLTRPPPGRPKLRGTDASHAWLSVWAPETGWVDFDPTNGLMPEGEHITVAYGRDYEDICPISGVLLGGGDQRMAVAVDVDPIP